MDNLNTNKDSFESLMQGMFEGMEDNADSMVWQNIEATLKSSANRGLAWWWWNGAAAIIVIAMFGLDVFDYNTTYNPRFGAFATASDVYLEDCSEENPIFRTAEYNDNKGVEKLISIAVIDSNQTIVDSDNSVIVSATNHSAVPAQHHSIDKVYAAINGADANPTDNRELLLKMIKNQLSRSWDTCLVAYRDEDIIKVYDDSEVDWQEWDNTSHSDWGLAANLGSSSSSEQTNNSFGTQSDGLATQENVVTMGVSDQRSIQELTYLSPFVIGFRGNWKFAKRFSLEIGLSYSLLPSNGESHSGGVKRMTRYTDHFIGVPILLNLSIIDRKRFGLYTSQGALVEKGIASRSILTTYIGNTEQSKQITKTKAQGTQLGASFGIGAEYRISKALGIFIEPRVNSWLVNVNVQENIRNQQVIWPTLDLGVRLNLK